MDIENKIRLLQLRKHNLNFGFISHYEGPILTKGGKKSKSQSDKVRSDFQKDADKFRWKAPPTARIAISFNIFCNQKNPPEIYGIVKYYLDLLQGPVFKDDKQVHYLEASIWRSNSKGTKSSIYIQARRLIDFFKILDIYQDIDHDYDSNDYDEDHLSPYLYSIDQGLWDIADKQYKLLKNSKISPYDRPGLRNYSRPTMMSRFCDIDPLTFDVGHLPDKGESQSFKKKIGSLFSEFSTKYSLFNKIYLPIEIDLQVTKANKKHFTDLDNIATSICKEINKFVLYDKVFINGYRVYVVDEIAKGIKADIRLKLLPPGEIKAYNMRMENALSNFENKLDDD
jgi:Holliday junction resolvase RusA-like endonuclease